MAVPDLALVSSEFAADDRRRGVQSTGTVRSIGQQRRGPALDAMNWVIMRRVQARILIVDSDTAAGAVLGNMLETAGHVPLRAASVPEALRALDHDHHDLVLADLQLQQRGGLELLEHVNQRWPELPVIMTAFEGTVADAVAAMRAGAWDFVLKPFKTEDVLYVVGKALTSVQARSARPPASARTRAPRLLGGSEPMQKLRDMIGRTASSNATVLVRGESGTGKGLVARSIHESSSRRDGPFAKIDCTSLPDALLESELFGYEKGAFTGAVTRKPGRVELAQGGTLFFDEIGDVSPAMQAKLLRLLQDKEFERLGGKQTLNIDVRFVCATHRDLETMVENGNFRQDLFYRLNVVQLWLAPLRARRNDIPELVRDFCERFAAACGKPSLPLSPEALRFVRSQRWPGNVRQLENFVERLVILSDGPTIGIEDVEREFAQRPKFVTQVTGAPSERSANTLDSPQELLAAVREAEKMAVITALERAGGNRSVAARVLGVSRSTLYYKLKELSIDN
jgi:two-component system, NtrC family, response regulator AtoC